MKNFKIKLAYDGSKYKGWQVQNSTSDTIQGKLENILLKLTGSPVDVIGSGRTDAGVHAMGQIANFHIELADDMSPDQLMEYINRYLPEDIAVLSLKEVDERFHARFSANSKPIATESTQVRFPMFLRESMSTATWTQSLILT